MKLNRIKSSACLSQALENLYIESFPPEERRPWASICDLVDHEPRFEMLEVSAGGESVGFVTLWHLGEVVYGEHLAIDPTRRGAGLGGKVVDAVIARSAHPWIIEVEPEGMTPEASRRIGFYARHGMILHDSYHYIQPPYGEGLPAVELKLMTSGAGVDLDNAVKQIHRHVYKTDK